MQARRSEWFHYGWLIVAAGTLCIFAGLGLGRFALGMLLPSMAASLGLSYSQMGLISTANFLGYLVAVLAGGFAVRHFGSRRLIFAALMIVGISMGLVGMAGGFLSVLGLYLLTGVGSGAANIPMMGLVTAWFHGSQRGRAAGFVVSGSGFAILLSGWMIPAVNQLHGDEGWRLSWMVLAAIVVVVAFVCLLILRDRPEDLGLIPVGEEREGPPESRTGESGGTPMRRSTLYHLGAIYFLFGFTYVIYATFFVTFLVKEHGYSETVAGTFWSAVGLLSLLSGPVFGTLSDRWGRKRCLMIVFAIQTMAYLLAASGRTGPFLYASVCLYGVVAWSIPSIMAALAGDHAGPEKVAQVFGMITFIFGIGQIAGPALAGYMADQTGSFTSSFTLAAAMTMLAIVLAALLKNAAGDTPEPKTPPSNSAP
jgi:MFS family permease